MLCCREGEGKPTLTNTEHHAEVAQLKKKLAGLSKCAGELRVKLVNKDAAIERVEKDRDSYRKKEFDYYEVCADLDRAEAEVKRLRKQRDREVKGRQLLEGELRKLNEKVTKLKTASRLVVGALGLIAADDSSWAGRYANDALDDYQSGVAGFGWPEGVDRGD